MEEDDEEPYFDVHDDDDDEEDDEDDPSDDTDEVTALLSNKNMFNINRTHRMPRLAIQMIQFPSFEHPILIPNQMALVRGQQVLEVRYMLSLMRLHQHRIMLVWQSR